METVKVHNKQRADKDKHIAKVLGKTFILVDERILISKLKMHRVFWDNDIGGYV